MGMSPAMMAAAVQRAYILRRCGVGGVRKCPAAPASKKEVIPAGASDARDTVIDDVRRVAVSVRRN